MRALQFTAYGQPDVVQVAKVPAPHPGPGEIRLTTKASGLSPGEVTLRSGSLHDAVPITFPYLTGFDAAGVVDEVGEGVTGVAIGDEVFGMTATTTRAANADHAVLAAWAPKPAEWSWEEAGGAAGSIETATRVLDRLAMGAGQTVLVQGAAGAVGTVALQLAVARGIAGDPGRVVTIAPDFTAAAHGVHMSHSAPTDDIADALLTAADPQALHDLAIAVDLAAEGRLRIPVAAAFPLTEAKAAHELSETRHANGKIVLLH
jgi:NADPH:quinone reductase-like Zn-dependent oxidoreductase